jgi:hypothetical protein
MMQGQLAIDDCPLTDAALRAWQGERQVDEPLAVKAGENHVS